VEVVGSGATVDFPATLRMNTDNANGIGFLQGDGPLVVNGTLDWREGIITGSGNLIINGSLTTSAGGNRVLDGRTLSNNGSIYLSEALRLANNALVANQAGGVIEIQNNQSINMHDAIGGSIDNAGTVLKNDVTGISSIKADFENSGVLDIETGALAFEKTLTNSAAGIIKGNGILDISNAVFSNAGFVAPGASPGILSINGDYSQNTSAGLNIEIGGVAAGAGYDRLDVSGSAELDGALNVTLASNFRPAPTDTFSIMNFSSRNGQFAAENVPIINNQSMFEVQYQAGEILLITAYAYQFTLDVGTVGLGRVELSPFGGMYDSLDVVTLTAIADSGYVFIGWSGDLSGSNNPESILMDTSKNVTATFTELPKYTLNLDTVSSGGVILSPPGGMYYTGTMVYLNAVPDSGYEFIGWSGDLSGSASPDSILMDSDKNVVATFSELPQYTLTVDTTGTGTVTLSPPGGIYYQGSMVALSAIPGSGHEFGGWSGGLTGLANPDTLVMDANKNVTAAFNPIPHHPIITSFTPTDGEVGTEVTINGMNFNSVSDVTFNGLSATGFVIDSDIQIRAAVPSGASNGLIGMANPFGTGTSADSFFVWYPPVISSFDPAYGHAGTEVTLSGSGFDEATAVLFNGVSAAFVIDSDTVLRAVVPAAAESGPISVNTPTGTAQTMLHFVVVDPPQVITFTTVADARVNSNSPNSNYGDANDLRASNAYKSYLKFVVSGVNGAIEKAILRLFCEDPSVDGGAFYPVDNNWEENTITWNNAPSITGAPVISAGPVPVDTWVELDITAEILGDSTYSFGITSATSDRVNYSSREGNEPPELVLETGSTPPKPQITSFNPDSGSVGAEITVTGSNFSTVNAVYFNGTAAMNVIVDSDTQFRAEVPPGAASGKIIASSVFGADTSSSNFTVIPAYNLTVNVSGSGAVALNPPGGVYDSSMVVALTAAPDPGYVFSGWSGDLTSTANPDSVVMNTAKSVTVIFTRQFSLATTVEGSGTITLDPPGGVYDSLTTVTLTATPDPGYVFSGWSGDLTGAANPDSVVMDTIKSVTAIFTHQFSLTTNITGSGTVTLDPQGGVYDSLTTVTLTATPDPGYVFSGWSGDLTGNANPDSVVMDTIKSVTAIFTHQFSLTTNITGSGTVTLDPQGGVYDSLTTVTLTATPDPGYVFSGWSGDLTGIANPDSVVMDTVKSVTAAFEKLPPPVVNVKVFLEGPYQNGSMVTIVKDNGGLPLAQPYNISPWNYSGGENVSSIPADVVDWVLVGLRSAETEADIILRAAFIKSDGSIVDTSGSGGVEFEGLAYGDYFVVIYHRNHLSIMSNSALPLSETSALYDFSTASAQAYGSNSMAEVETGVFAMICGDGNADGVVDESDHFLWRSENGTAWSYGKGGDFNLDGGIDAADLNFFWRANNGLLSGVPGSAAAAALLKLEVSTGHK